VKRHWSLILLVVSAMSVTIWRNVLWFQNGMGYHAGWAQFLAFLSGAGVFVLAFYSRRTRWAGFGVWVFIAFDFLVNEAEVIRTLNSEQLLFVSGDFLGVGPELIQRVFQLVGLATGGFPTIASALAGIVLSRAIGGESAAKHGGTSSGFDWRLLSADERAKLTGKSAADIRRAYPGIPPRTALNWHNRSKRKGRKK